MKKKLIMCLAMVAMLVCALAFSVSAADTSETVTVTLSDGSTTECALYDAEGNALVWYTLDGGATVQSVKTSDLFSNASGALLTEATYLGDIYLNAETALQKHADNTTNMIVVANLRDCTFKTVSHYSYKTTFGDSKVIQYAYLPNTITALGCNIFQNCTSLKVCDLPADASYQIGDANTFVGCTSLKEINLLGCTKIVGHSTFSGCKALAKVLINPETINYPSIDNSAYKDCPLTQFGLTEGECTIPTSTTYIGNATFSGAKFTKLVMGDNVTTLGWNVFSNNTSLVEAQISSNITKSDIRVFLGCTSLTTVIGLDSCALTSIPTEMFMNTALTEVVLPDSCTVISTSAFKGCASLVSITIPAGFTLIDDYAFQNCKALASVNFLGNAAEKAVIDTAVFENCSALTTLAIPEGVTTLGNCVCKSAGIEVLSLPTTLTTVSGGEHFYRTKLTTVIGLENTKLTSISSSMFRGLSSWKADVVRLPDTVKTIGQYGMADCGASVFILGTGVETIYTEAFVNCSKVVAYYIPETITSIGSSAFRNNINKNFKIFVTGSDATYIDAVKASASITTDAITYETYIANTEAYETGMYVVTGVNKCVAFNDGKHTWSGKDEIAMNGYFETIIVGDSCVVCSSVEAKSTIAPLFVSMGISAKTFGADIGLVQGYQINRDAIDAYKAYVPDFNFGVLAYANIDGTAVAPKPGDDKVVDVVFDNAVNSYIEVKVTGIPADFYGTPVVFCIYATEGDKFYYLDNGNTTETIVGSSYNEYVG